jgi:glycine cleavage system regulatory protein
MILSPDTVDKLTTALQKIETRGDTKVSLALAVQAPDVSTTAPAFESRAELSLHVIEETPEWLEASWRPLLLSRLDKH